MDVGQAKTLKTGDRVKYTCEGPDYGDQGTVAVVMPTGIEVAWDDADEGETLDYEFRHGDFYFRNLAKM